ncbi:MAG: response regulator transcription factor [Candidatus Obscuribacterales bacterium]
MSDEDFTPQPKPETERGGSGRKGKTAVGTGNGGSFDDFQYWPSGEGGSPSANRPSVVIYDRSLLFRFAFAAMLEPAALIVSDVVSADALVESASTRRPDLLLMSFDDEELHFIELCRRLSVDFFGASIIVATNSYLATKYHNQLVRAGVLGVCLKSSDSDVFLEAVSTTSRKRPYCDPAIERLIKQSQAMPVGTNLTDREIEVLVRLDLRNDKIAEELGMKLRTVEKYIECILAKLKVPTRSAAALKAIELGLVLLPKVENREQEQGEAVRRAESAIAEWLRQRRAIG